MVIPFCKCENWYKFILYQFFLNNVFLRNKATIYCGQSGTPGGNRTHNGPLGGGCYIHLTTEVFILILSQTIRCETALLFPRPDNPFRKIGHSFPVFPSESDFAFPQKRISRFSARPSLPFFYIFLLYSFPRQIAIIFFAFLKFCPTNCCKTNSKVLL